MKLIICPSGWSIWGLPRNGRKIRGKKNSQNLNSAVCLILAGHAKNGYLACFVNNSKSFGQWLLVELVVLGLVRDCWSWIVRFSGKLVNGKVLWVLWSMVNGIVPLWVNG